MNKRQKVVAEMRACAKKGRRRMETKRKKKPLTFYPDRKVWSVEFRPELDAPVILFRAEDRALEYARCYALADAPSVRSRFLIYDSK